jgi:hypothetical protein
MPCRIPLYWREACLQEVSEYVICLLQVQSRAESTYSLSSTPPDYRILIRQANEEVVYYSLQGYLIYIGEVI